MVKVLTRSQVSGKGSTPRGTRHGGNVAHLPSSPIRLVCGLSENQCPLTVCWEKSLVLILVKKEPPTLCGLELR